MDKKIKKIITHHAGNKSSDGGEYEEGYYVLPDGSEYKFNSSDLPFCPCCGRFHNKGALVICEDCQRFGEKEEEWDKKKEIIRSHSVEEVNKTGHEYKPCYYEGGCVICHPCGHKECSVKTKESD